MVTVKIRVVAAISIIERENKLTELLVLILLQFFKGRCQK